MERVFQLWRSGELSRLLRRRQATEGEWAEREDWLDPPVHVISMSVRGKGNLSADNPTFELAIQLIHGSVFPVELQPDIRGRIRVDDAELNQQPEFLQLSADHTGRLLRPGDDWTIQRNMPTTISLRQHVLPAVAEKMSRGDVGMTFGQLDIGVCCIREVGATFEKGPRKRLPLPSLVTYT